VGLSHTLQVALNALHMARPASIVRKLATMPKYAVKDLPDTDSSPTSLNTLRITQPTLSNICNVASTDPTPLITVYVSSPNGSSNIKVLGADISVAGKEILEFLNEHTSRLLPSHTVPRGVNGAKIHPLGKLHVDFQLGDRKYSDELHIYPNVWEILILWKVCKAFGILPYCYPYPVSPWTILLPLIYCHIPSAPIPSVSLPQILRLYLLQQNMSRASILLFDAQIRSMDGETFHISLTSDAKPFCVNTP